MTNPEIIFNAYRLYEHSIDEETRRTNSYIMAKQPNDQFGYFNTNQFALTSSNTFVGNQIISGNLDVTGTITGNALFYNYTSTGSIYMTGSIETNCCK